MRFKGLSHQQCSHTFHNERKNALSWHVYPQGLFDILINLKKYGLDVIITENGTAEDKNSFYQEYLVSHLKSIGKAIDEGAGIRGYLWWSLLDNFEWDKGFKYRFGLAEVDYNTFTRRLRPFSHIYSRICKENELKI